MDRRLWEGGGVGEVYGYRDTLRMQGWTKCGHKMLFGHHEISQIRYGKMDPRKLLILSRIDRLAISSFLIM